MKFSTNNKKINEIKSDCLMISIFNDGKLRGCAKLVNTANGKLIDDFIKNKDIQGKIGQTRIIPVTGNLTKGLFWLDAENMKIFHKRITEKQLYRH